MFALMVDHGDTNLGNVHETESSPRFNEFYDRMQMWQFGMPRLRELDEEELVYMAGHREYDYPSNPESSDPVEDLGKQQKVRGNALRAKDELDRRHGEAQMHALVESNRTNRRLVCWTIVIALASPAVTLLAAWLTRC